MKALFSRTATTISARILILPVVDIIFRGHAAMNWWTLENVLWAVLLLGSLIALVWLAFVPRVFEYTDGVCVVEFRFRSRHKRLWEDLEWYGCYDGLSRIKFKNDHPIVFYSNAYMRNELRHFVAFLQSHFPDKIRRNFG